MSTKDEIRANLSRLLGESGIKNAELARRVGVSKAAVSNWLSGENSIDIDLVPAICDVFGVTIDEFLGHGRPAHELLSPDERELIDIYRNMDSRARHDLMQIAASLSTSASNSASSGDVMEAV